MGMFDQPRGMFAVDDRDTSSLGGLIADYLRNVMSGQIAASGPLGQNFYDPNRSLAQNALDPRAIASATDIGMSLSAGPIRAYHGSPYDFDKFDLSKIGTGEGAQAYGHGLYFAEAEPVARSYRDALGPDAAMNALDGFLRRNRGVNLRPEEVADRLSGTPAAALAQDPKAIESLQKLLPQYLPNMPVMGSDLVHYRYLDDAAQRMIPGRMYEVDIHADPDAFLNWEKPLSAQGEPARQAVAKIPALQEASAQAPDMLDHLTGATVHELIRPRGQGMGQSPFIAEQLRNAGIPGIKYLDQGSRGAGQGTSNYVVFDPSIIEILRKYGILGPVAAPGALMPFMGDQQQ